ncbi:MAG: hypothetical protein SO063_06400 [Eubacteriales bacterium]|nr:hypothetical protein [Eubacteriales bacterium]
MNPKRRLLLCAAALLLILAGIVAWRALRSACTVSCPSGGGLPDPPYTETERVMKAVSLSYLVYGCEACDVPTDPDGTLSGTVSELLDTCRMGIISENFGIRRTELQDPSSALLDSAAFIRTHTGPFRFLTSLKSGKSGFYGAAFCDDEQKCVWISYSGAVSLQDCLACAALVLVPGLSAQEASAFALFETVMGSREVQEDGYTVLLTGHSLGGALAAAVSRASGCAAVTINGADGLAIDKLNAILGAAPEEYRITNYMTSPKNGRFSLMDVVQRLMFLGSYRAADYRIYAENGLTYDTHSVFSFIDPAEGGPSLPVPVEWKTTPAGS